MRSVKTFEVKSLPVRTSFPNVTTFEYKINHFKAFHTIYARAKPVNMCIMRFCFTVYLFWNVFPPQASASLFMSLWIISVRRPYLIPSISIIKACFTFSAKKLLKNVEDIFIFEPMILCSTQQTMWPAHLITWSKFLTLQVVFHFCKN